MSGMTGSGDFFYTRKSKSSGLAIDNIAWTFDLGKLEYKYYCVKHIEGTPKIDKVHFPKTVTLGKVFEKLFDW